MRRREYILTVGATVGLAGCTAGNNRQGTTGSNGTTTNGSETGASTGSDSGTNSKATSPAATVRQFYSALLAGNVEKLNNRLVHPESPTYPVTESYLPPEAFKNKVDVTIKSVEPASVQSRVVQIRGEPTKTLDWKRAMGVDGYQYVHTVFNYKKSKNGEIYTAHEVDYTVEENGSWYVRYDANKVTHGQ